MGNIFSKKDPDFERELSDLDERIHLIEGRLLHRSATYRKSLSVLILSCLALFFCLLIVFWVDLGKGTMFGRVPWSSLMVQCIFPIQFSSSTVQSLYFCYFCWMLVFGIIFACYFSVYSALSYLYHRRVEDDKSTLESLKSRQKMKLEELKKKFNYYTTKDLLERFEASIKPILADEEGSLRKRENVKANHDSGLESDLMPSSRRTSTLGPFPHAPNSMPVSPVGPLTVSHSGTNAHPATIPLPPSPPVGRPSSQSMTAPFPLSHTQPTPRTWMDRLLDALIGQDPLSLLQASNSSSSSSSLSLTHLESIFALICIYCGGHNGLVNRIEYERGLKYSCPKCGQWNDPSLLREGALAPSLEESSSMSLESSGLASDSGLSHSLPHSDGDNDAQTRAMPESAKMKDKKSGKGKG